MSALRRASALLYVGAYLAYGAHGIIHAIPESHRSPFGAHPIKYGFNYDTQRLALRLKDESSPGDAYVCLHPNMMDLLTARKGYGFPLSRDPERLMKLLTDKRIRYVLVDKRKPSVRKFALPVIRSHPEEFRLIEDAKRASLYEFRAWNAVSPI